ncbi:hypothetical protein ACF05L_12580 [Streptomyces bobili]|uniref:hypothetical protein n=1 Tax=Streptomyces bobili TaxID=67280 RepID=UPI0036FDB3B3
MPLHAPFARPAVTALAATLFGQLLAGTATAAPQPPAPVPPTGRAVWEPCASPSGEGTFECATVQVPVDWKRPRGATLCR